MGDAGADVVSCGEQACEAPSRLHRNLCRLGRLRGQVASAHCTANLSTFTEVADSIDEATKNLTGYRKSTVRGRTSDALHTVDAQAPSATCGWRWFFPMSG